MISKKMTVKFQKIVKEEYGKELTYKEARKIVNDLVELFDVLARMSFAIKKQTKKHQLK